MPARCCRSSLRKVSPSAAWFWIPSTTTRAAGPSSGGRAAPGARMLVYLNNRPIGEAVADGEGRWALSPASPILEGLHDLRVDQLADDGSVIARV